MLPSLPSDIEAYDIVNISMNDEVSAPVDNMRPMPNFECLHACEKWHDIVLLADIVNWQRKNDRSCRLEVFFHPFLYSYALQGEATKVNASQAYLHTGQYVAFE